MPDLPHAHVAARAIAYEETGSEDWSEVETSYAGGGYRIDRERLSARITAAIEADRRNRVPTPPPTAVHRTATVVQFRAKVDLSDPRNSTNLSCRVTTFKGVLLGTTGDGQDVVAAFPFPHLAERFLALYLLDDAEPLGAHELTAVAL